MANSTQTLICLQEPFYITQLTQIVVLVLNYLFLRVYL